MTMRPAPDRVAVPEPTCILVVVPLLSSAKSLALASLTSDTEVLYAALPPTENSISFSRGLKVTDSAAPENVPMLT